MTHQSTPMDPMPTPSGTNRRYNTRSQKRKRSVIALYDSGSSVNGLPTPEMGQMLLRGRLPETGNVNKKRAVKDWLGADAGAPIPSIDDVMVISRLQGKYGTRDIHADSLCRDYFFEPYTQPNPGEQMDGIESKLCSRSPSPFCWVLHMDQEPQTPYGASGVFEIPPLRQDAMQWQQTVPSSEEKVYWRDKSIPECVALPEVQSIPTAAEIRTPTPFPEPQMPFGRINWNPPLREPREEPVDPMLDTSNRPISISSSSYAWPRSPRRGPSTEPKSAPFIASRNQSEGVDPLDPNPSAIIPSVAEVNEQAATKPLKSPITAPVQAQFPGKGPFWENYKDKDYSGYIRPE
ncbi:hypothetical protein BDW69DRAFT_180441 [Aspergillus filifer]